MTGTRRLLIGNVDGLFALGSHDGGDTWEDLTNQLPGVHLCAIEAMPDGTVYLGSRGAGLFKGNDNLSAWEALPTPDYARKIRSLRASKDGLLVGTEPAGVYRHRPEDGTWTAVGDIRQAPGSSNWFYPVPTEDVHIRHLALDPEQADRLYAAVQVGGVAISQDGGATWRDKRNLDLDVHMVEPHPERPEVVFAGTGGEGLYRSPDHGESWELVSNGCGNFVVQFALTPGNPDRLYLGTARGHPPKWAPPNGAGGEIYRSTDGGRGWSKLSSGMPERLASRISAVWVDPNHPNDVFFGAGLTFRDINPPDGGVYHSADGGDSWRKIADTREPEFVWTVDR